MKSILSLHLPPRLSAPLLAGLLLGVIGCASNSNALSNSDSPASEKSDASQKTSEQARQAPKSDPFEVARVWASKLPGAKGDAEMLPPEVHSITASWSDAQVARVWVAGDEYRALIIERSTAGERPAVLLYISSDRSGAWQVQAVKPSTSTALWSEF